MFLTFAGRESGMYDCTFILSVGLEAFINLLRHEAGASAGSHTHRHINIYQRIAASQEGGHVCSASPAIRRCAGITVSTSKQLG